MERFDEQLRERAQREPFPIPEDYAGRVFLLDILYRRHGDADDANPWARRADEEAARLRALASGTEAVDASADGVVISKPARIYDTPGVMS